MIGSGSLLPKARDYHRGGLSLAPVRKPGSKFPKGFAWERRQHARQTDRELEREFSNGAVGIAVICGAISGGLEVIDFDNDGEDFFAPWKAEMDRLAPGLVDTLTHNETPARGHHLGYRCEAVEGNQQFAYHPVEGKDGRLVKKIAIETRGEGGLIIAPGSKPETHPDNRPYVHVGGPDLADAPLITPEQRALMHKVARSFDRWFDERPIQSDQKEQPDSQQRTGTLPGEGFAQRTSWPEILEPHGWTVHHQAGQTTYWKRPGKSDDGWSGTTGYATGQDGSELFCVFSSNAPHFTLPAGEKCGAFGKFATFALLNHGGDFKAAAKELYAKGYGDRVKASTTSGSSQSAGPDIWKPEGRTDAANGQRLIARFGDRIRYCGTWGKWLVNADGKWSVDEICQIEAMAKKVAKDLWIEVHAAEGKADEGQMAELVRFAKASNKVSGWENAIKAARSEPGISISHKALDADHWKFNVRNGTIDLKTGRLLPHDPKDLITKQAPVEYLPSCEAECPGWLSMVDGILDGNQSLIRFLARLLGYGMTGDVREQILTILWGEGSNGKSTIVEIIIHVMGDYATAAVPDLLMVRRGEAHLTELADLYGRRAVFTSESENGQQLSEGRAKRLTGADLMTVRRMREDPWTFSPTHKLFLSTNHRPRIVGEDHAIWRRLVLFPFNVRFWDPDKNETGPEHLQVKKTLKNDLLANEAPGILRWLVEGCLEWQRDGLQMPDEVRAATNSYRQNEDLLATFLAKCCVVDSKAFCRATSLFEEYQSFTGDKDTTQKRLFELMTARGFRNDRFTAGPNKGRMGWFGVGILSGASEG